MGNLDYGLNFLSRHDERNIFTTAQRSVSKLVNLPSLLAKCNKIKKI